MKHIILIFFLNGCATMPDLWISSTLENYPQEYETGAWIEKADYMEAETVEYRANILSISLEIAHPAYIINLGVTPQNDAYTIGLSVPINYKD